MGSRRLVDLNDLLVAVQQRRLEARLLEGLPEGSVLDRFLGLSVSVNSFSQVTVVSRQRQTPLGRWPARAGRKVLL